jgi:hypothetical protein
LFGDRSGHQDHRARVDSVVLGTNSAPCFPPVAAIGMVQLGDAEVRTVSFYRHPADRDAER